MTTTERGSNVNDGDGAAIRQTGNSRPGTVTGRLQALEQMDYATLRSEWRRLYRSPAPQRVARGLLLLGVAWKIQERADGGLGAACRRRLAELARTVERDGDGVRDRIVRLKPGAKLVREWRGRTHTVRVLDDGFEWDGRRWRSLSAVARAITGAHWSGPRFFALQGKGRPQSGARAAETVDG